MFATTDQQLRLVSMATPRLHEASAASPAALQVGGVGDATIAPSPAKLIRGGLAPRALRRVLEFIEVNLEGPTSVALLAGVAGLSPFHFARAFKQSTGATPHEYLLQRRVARVRELLADTNLPLSEIALAAGFADQSHCARRFRERVGMRPRDYRWSTR